MRTSPTAKLNIRMVREIRARLEAGERGSALAREYGVNESSISRIRNGKAYREQDAQSAEPQEAA